MRSVNQKYCRLCAEIKCDAILVDSTILEKLSFFGVEKITFSSDDPLPKNVCLPCSKSLDDAYEFIVKVKRSQTLLLAIPELSVKTEGPYNDRVPNTVKIEVISAEEFDSDRPEDSSFPDESDENNESKTKVCQSKTKFCQSKTKVCQSKTKVCQSKTKVCQSKTKVCQSKAKVCKSQNATTLKAEAEKSMPKDDSWSAYNWDCKLCDEVFVNMGLLREHCVNAHDSCCVLCSECKETFTNFDEFILHMQGLKDTLRYYCAYCNMKLEINNLTKDKDNQNICEKCCHIFDDKQTLRRHFRKSKRNLNETKMNVKAHAKKCKKVVKDAEKSWKGYPWTCQLCQVELGDLSLLRTHAKEVHNKCFAVKCVDCDKQMQSFKEFIVHVRYHRRYLKRLCHYCDHAFVKTESRPDHIATHFTESAKLCQGCGEILPDTMTYQSHVTAYNPPKSKIRINKLDRPLTKDDVTCDICQKVYKGTFSLREHKLNMHSVGEKKFVCEKCGKLCVNKSALGAHQLTHGDSKPLVCEICKKGFLRRCEFRQHVTMHTEEKLFQCEVCDKRFRLKKQLTAHHMRIHKGERPFACNFCEKAFPERSRLREHENLHTGARPYICRDCGMEYASWKSCEKHMRTKHGSKMAQKTVEKGLNSEVKDLEKIKEWAKRVLAPKRRKKTDQNSGNN